MGIVAHPKHVTHIGPRSGFPYHNLTISPSTGAQRNAMSSSVGLSHGKFQICFEKHRCLGS